MGYFSLWRDPDGLLQLAKVFLCEGGEVFWDMTHLYFAIYSAPKKPPGDFWHTRTDEWHRLADALGAAIRVQLGFHSRCNTLALLTFMSLAASGRTISEPVGRRVLSVLTSIWQFCQGPGISDQIAVSAGGYIVLAGGCIDLDQACAALPSLAHTRALLQDARGASAWLRGQGSRVELPRFFLALSRTFGLRPSAALSPLLHALLQSLTRAVDAAICQGKVAAPLTSATPPGARTRYRYGCSDRGYHWTRPDQQELYAQAKKAKDSQGIKAPDAHQVLRRDNVLYMCKSLEKFQDSWRQYRTVHLVGDEARFSDTSCLSVFASFPVTRKECWGVSLPVQLMPELLVDLRHKTIPMRLLDSMARSRVVRPTADALSATWANVEGFHHALSGILPGGLANFARGASPPSTLVVVSDQDSSLFAFATHALTEHYRIVYFPDVNHQESNDVTNTMNLMRALEHKRKFVFLAKCNHGPWRGHAGGKWKKLQEETFDLYRDRLWEAGSAEEALWEQYYPDICADLGVSPLAADSKEKALRHMHKVARKKGILGSTSRWMSADDCARVCIRNRHTRMFLVDCALVMLNSNPCPI